MSFPPLFPRNKYLKKQPWHQVIFIFSFIYSACSLYSSFFILYLLLEKLELIKPSGWEGILGLPLSVPLFPLKFFITTPLNQSSASNSTYFADPNWGLIILMIYFLISVFLPSLIYLILLKGFLGPKWQK